MITLRFETAVLEVVRGEKEWTILKNLGVNIHLEGDTWVFLPSQEAPICPDIQDFARGILNLYYDKEKLQKWASFLLAASAIIDFEAIEISHHGELLLDSLWELSFRGELNEEVIQVAKSLVSEAK